MNYTGNNMLDFDYSKRTTIRTINFDRKQEFIDCHYCGDTFLVENILIDEFNKRICVECNECMNRINKKTK